MVCVCMPSVDNDGAGGVADAGSDYDCGGMTVVGGSLSTA